VLASGTPPIRAADSRNRSSKPDWHVECNRFVTSLGNAVDVVPISRFVYRVEGQHMKTRIVLGLVTAFGVVILGNPTVFAQSMMGGGSRGTMSGTAATSSTSMGSTGMGIAVGGYGGGSYGGGYSPGSGTIAGSYLSGAGALADGLGQYNYKTALAIRQLEDANHQAIDNQLSAQKSRIEIRRLNRIQWLADHPHSTPEQMTVINQARLPRRLTAGELDPTWGQIRWPAVLQRSEFDKMRIQLDDVFAHRSNESFGVGTAAYGEVQHLTSELRTALDQEYTTMSQMEWIQAMRFIESLAYESRFAPGAVVDANVH
jgi:hypothetical protein